MEKDSNKKEILFRGWMNVFTGFIPVFVPVNRKGWLVTFLYPVLLFAIVPVMIFVRDNYSFQTAMMVGVLYLVCLTVFFNYIGFKKGKIN